MTSPAERMPNAWLGGLDQAALADLCERFAISRLRLYGSRARDDYRPDSDVDLIADFMEPVGLLRLIEAEQAFSDTLGLPVDLHTERELSPYLRDRILHDARVVYDRAA